MRHSIFYIIPLCFVLMLFSCDELRVFEKNQDLKSAQWASKDSLRFEVSIEDSKPKNVYLNLRHSFDFGWRNAWVNLIIGFPNDSTYAIPVNIPLSQPDGHWYGDCTGSICNIQFPVHELSDFSFNQTGDYTFTLVHEMREDPLLEVLSTGIRIENTAKPE